MEVTSGGKHDETSELLKQQYAYHARSSCASCGAHSRFRYSALVQEANRVKQEYKLARAQVSANLPTALPEPSTRILAAVLRLTLAFAAAVVSAVAN